MPVTSTMENQALEYTPKTATLGFILIDPFQNCADPYTASALEELTSLHGNKLKYVCPSKLRDLQDQYGHSLSDILKESLATAPNLGSERYTDGHGTQRWCPADRFLYESLKSENNQVINMLKSEKLVVTTNRFVIQALVKLGRSEEDRPISLKVKAKELSKKEFTLLGLADDSDKPRERKPSYNQALKAYLVNTAEGSSTQRNDLYKILCIETDDLFLIYDAKIDGILEEQGKLFSFSPILTNECRQTDLETSMSSSGSESISLFMPNLFGRLGETERLLVAYTSNKLLKEVRQYPYVEFRLREDEVETIKMFGKELKHFYLDEMLNGPSTKTKEWNQIKVVKLNIDDTQLSWRSKENVNSVGDRWKIIIKSRTE